MEYDIHTVLDFLTLVATVWVIYTLRIPLKDTYQEEQDSVQTYYVVGYLILCQRTSPKSGLCLRGLMPRVIFVLVWTAFANTDSFCLRRQCHVCWWQPWRTQGHTIRWFSG